MGVSDKQIEAILLLPAPQRYSHFIKKVVGWKQAWALDDDGWALASTDAGEPVFPLWPERAYAERCMVGDWSGYTPTPIGLDELLDEIIPMLREKNIHPGVFFTDEHGSIDTTLDELERDLRTELSKYA